MAPKRNSKKSATSKATAASKPAPMPAAGSPLPAVPPLPRLSKTVRSHLRSDSDIDGDVGRTPLHCAARNGHIEVVRVLLGVDATNVAALDRHGRTALMEAVRANAYDVVAFMLSDPRACKTVNVMDADGQVPLLAAIQFGCALAVTRAAGNNCCRNASGGNSQCYNVELLVLLWHFMSLSSRAVWQRRRQHDQRMH